MSIGLIKLPTELKTIRADYQKQIDQLMLVIKKIDEIEASMIGASKPEKVVSVAPKKTRVSRKQLSKQVYAFIKEELSGEKFSTRKLYKALPSALRPVDAHATYCLLWNLSKKGKVEKHKLMKQREVVWSVVQQTAAWPSAQKKAA